ncbi:MAG: hypothetical protein CO090_09045 [Acidobacteria bacterium CG_4_9_14_3_um_filter_49_7]|nr:MAG: hypothetical protein CO090_09045 [Acidobacteria bacterium CG_4_9_14_3_um_filter_49_7]
MEEYTKHAYDFLFLSEHRTRSPEANRTLSPRLPERNVQGDGVKLRTVPSYHPAYAEPFSAVRY